MVMFAPFVTVVVAVLVGFMAFVGPVARFAAVGAEMFYGFMITRLCVGHAAIAIIPAIGLGRWRTGKEEKASECQRDKCCFAENRTESGRSKFH